MKKRCRAFGSETKSAYVSHKIEPRQPIIIKSYWGDEDKIETKVDEKAESYARNLQLDRYKTVSQKYFNLERFEQALNEEEIDLGNELIEYLKKSYHTPPVLQMTRLPYSTTKIFGCASPKLLITPFSNYQDTTGRTGGEVILKNLKKVIMGKLRTKIREKLRSNMSRESEWTKNVVFPGGS